MPRRRYGKYGLRPGLGLYWREAAGYPSQADLEFMFDEMFPAAKGVPRDPRVRAWKRKVMSAAWRAAVRYIRQGLEPEEAYRRALKTAYKMIPHPRLGFVGR